MKIRQRVYLGVRSSSLTPEEITRRVGFEPDRAVARGSKSLDPVRPAVHLWQVICDEPGLRVDEQFRRVVERVKPYAAALKALNDGPDHTVAVLQVVREFDATDGEEEVEQIIEDWPELVKLSGQHQLLGLHLDADLIRFLTDTGLEVDFDEYG